MNDVAILGINAYHGDTAAAILLNGQLIAAVEEERFRRIKHCAGFPRNAIEECLRLAGISARDLDHIAVSRNPRANLFRKVRFALSKRPTPRLIIDRAKNQAEVSALTTTIA